MYGLEGAAGNFAMGRRRPRWVDSAPRDLQKGAGSDRLFLVFPLLWCLTWCMGIALEIALPGQTSPNAWWPALAALCTTLGLLHHLRNGRGRGLVLAGTLLAGLSRADLEPQETPLHPRTGLLRASILRASAPLGERCEVLADLEGDTWLLRVSPEICPLAAGAQIWIQAGDLSPLGPALWPGATPLVPARAGARAAAEPPRVWRAGGSEAGYWRGVAELRHEGVLAGREDPALAFVVASVLGQATALAPEGRRELRDAGLGHVVAVSGMNVAIAAALVQAPLRRAGLVFGGGLRAALLLAWAPVLAYLGLTGGDPPALRAALMFGLGQLAVLIGRPTHGLTALALSAALLLAWRPAWATDPGLHLSLAAMAVLVHPDAPRGLLAQSWRVSWGTLPITLVHFGTFPLIGVLANTIAVPVFTLWVLPLGVLGLACMPCWGPAALGPAALGGQVILDVAALAARAPQAPPLVLAALALVGLALRARARGPALLRWVPGPLTLAATLAALAWVARVGPREPARAWAALGSPAAMTVLCPASSDPTLACVRDPTLAPEAWPELLRALGFRGAAAVFDPRSPPAAAAVQAELEDRSMMHSGTCPVGPSRKFLRQALAGCAALRGARRTAARAGPAGPECWTGSGWEPLAAETP